MKPFRWMVFAIVSLLARPSISQVLYPESEYLDYYRILEIKNPDQERRLNIFPSILIPYGVDSLGWDAWGNNTSAHARLVPVRWAHHYNSSYARSYNDGALWRGKGYTTSIQGGVQGKIGKLEFTLAPIVYFSQNADFELAEPRDENNPYNYQFRNKRIDYVQRYGDASFAAFNPGQSEVRAVFKKATIGVSTQNIVFGPAQFNPLILSNNASGIPHIDIGTYKPIKTRIGWIEGKVYYGMLKKSDYFDGSDEWNYRYWSALSVGYSPGFLPELTIGFNRAFYEKSTDFSPIDLLVFINKFDDTDGDPRINDEFDQMGSITMRWLFPEVGFEAYAEYGKNDFGGKIWGTAPEHARAYTLGISKYIDLTPSSILKLTYEHTSLDKAKNSIYRPYNSWYSHGIVKSGYTIDGQIIGGGIGTGSVSDVVDAQYFSPKGRLMFRIQRIRFDDDYFFEEIQDELNHDHEWTLESAYSQFWGSYLVGFGAGLHFRQNQYFIKENDKTNLSLSLSITRAFGN
ncbi:MAG: capsule assembly Wzi family protein [Ekhidna sp.]|uniref:capsule assembly Wzi family protein n=1 Tax=Ekhidna sp. TaxID=2608089 RepID=UPI0032EBA1E9